MTENNNIAEKGKKGNLRFGFLIKSNRIGRTNVIIEPSFADSETRKVLQGDNKNRFSSEDEND